MRFHCKNCLVFLPTVSHLITCRGDLVLLLSAYDRRNRYERMITFRNRARLKFQVTLALP